MSIPEIKNQGDKPMWPSFETAAAWFNVANVALLVSLVVGVIATFGVVWMGRVKEEYLRGDVANANARAAEAQLELAKLKAPRSLTNAQIDSLAHAMSPFKGYHVSVGATVDTYEAVELAAQIDLALKKAGLAVDMFQIAAQIHVKVARGVAAVFVSGNEKAEKLATAFAHTMNELGVSAAAENGLMEKGVVEAERREPGARAKNDWVIIAVGDKI